MNSIGERIFELRQKNNLSQERFAELIGKKKSNISGYENDKFEPSAQTIIAICELFNVSSDWLLFGEEKRGLKLEQPSIELAPGDVELLAKFHQLTERDQGRVEGTIETLLMNYPDTEQMNTTSMSSRSKNTGVREDAAARSETA